MSPCPNSLRSATLLAFVGAGVIFKDENRISGITTATTIWMTAALGMAAGAGYELLSLFATLIVLIVLIFLIYLNLPFLNYDKYVLLVRFFKVSPNVLPL